MNIEWQEVGFVAIAGGVGGTLSWVHSAAVGTPMQLGWFGSPLASLCLGMGAGVLGVYLVAKTDMQAALHGLVFAMACGFAWRPVFEGAEALVGTRIENQQLQTIETETDAALESSSQLIGLRGERTVVTLDHVVNSAVRALRVPTRSTSTIEQRSARLEDVVTNISRAEGLSTDERIECLRRIGSSAAAAGDQNIAYRSMQSIAGLLQADNASAETKARAADAVENIGAKGGLRFMPALQLNSDLLGTSIRTGRDAPVGPILDRQGLRLER